MLQADQQGGQLDDCVVRQCSVPPAAECCSLRRADSLAAIEQRYSYSPDGPPGGRRDGQRGDCVVRQCWARLPEECFYLRQVDSLAAVEQRCSCSPDDPPDGQRDD